MRFFALLLCAAVAVLPSVQGQTCFNDITQISNIEAQVQDVNLPRTYVLCPNTVYPIGTYDFSFDLVGNFVQPPFPARPNVNFRCGDNGAKENLCFIVAGDVQVDATKSLGITDQDRVDNVSFWGFTFMQGYKYSLWATKPGSITFRDCEWREFTQSVAPIMMDFFDGGNDRLVVNFESCLFTHNRYFGILSQSALVYANGAQNHLNIDSTIFSYNNMVFNNTMPATNSFIIETLGPLNMENTCFEHNLVGVSNAVVFGNALVSTDNYITNSTGSLCGYSAVFETVQQFDNFSPICIGGLSDTCNAYGTRSPTNMPSPPPTESPTLSPVVGMTPMPSAATTTAEPTVSSTDSPSSMIVGSTSAPSSLAGADGGSSGGDAGDTDIPISFATPAPTGASETDASRGVGSGSVALSVSWASVAVGGLLCML